MAGLREAVDDPWVFNVLHYHGLLAAPGPSLVERVEAALASVRPMLAQHDGDVELVGVEGDTAKVRLVGSCDGCAFQDATLRDGVEAAVLAAVPEITKVRLVVAEAPKLVRLEGRARMGSGSGSGAVIEASPFSRPWIDAGAAEAVREGEVVAVELDAASVLLTRHRGEIKAFPNACTHLGMPLEGGYVEDGVLTCPYHGFRYRLDSGECLTAPDVALVCYPARVEGERVQVQVLT
nr:NifU family protein [Pseudenhygromyxa sp. WMMC2535]